MTIPLPGLEASLAGGNSASPASLDSFWMPFTGNRDFKTAPRLVVGAQGHHYLTADGRKLYDMFSGLWTSGLGHCHPAITEAVSQQIAKLDYAMTFQLGSENAFLLAERLKDIAPAGFGPVFFTNSGSESADTSLKIALAYHHARGESGRTIFVGRERGYHGVNFGGLSIGGIAANRNRFTPALLGNVDHLRHTHDLQRNAFSRGQPLHGVEFADDLERLCALHGGDNIAAVIVEPVAGSTGILPPPAGYLKRLREICDRHGILLIFDEVITAFGRVGASFAAERFGVIPDMINTAKGLTNGVIPMGAVLTRQGIYDAICQGPTHVPEFFHGYTYSGHPVAAAAGIATLDTYQNEGAFEQARALEPIFEDALHSLADHPKVADIRNFGLMGGVELVSRDGAIGARGLDVHKTCFWNHDLVLRNGGDCIQFSPFLNAKPQDIEISIAKIRKVLDEVN